MWKRPRMMRFILKHVPWFFNSDSKILLASLIWCCHTSPKAGCRNISQADQPVCTSNCQEMLNLLMINVIKSFFNSLSTPIKFVPFPDLILLTLPHLAMNRFSTGINKFVSVEFVISICTGIHAKHVNIAPYFFGSFLLTFMISGAEFYESEWINNSSSWKFCPLFYVPNLPPKTSADYTLLMTFLMILFPHIIQKPGFLNWWSVTPLPEYPTLMWHHSRIFLETMKSYGSTIRWRRFSLYVDLFSLPPILIILSSAKNGSNL